MRLGQPEPRGETPRVDFGRPVRTIHRPRDLVDGRVTERAVAGAFVAEAERASARIYPSYVEADLIAPVVWDEHDYPWEDFSDTSEPFPAPTLVVRADGSVGVLDGNHRVFRWQREGYRWIPAWVVDLRAGARPATNPGRDEEIRELEREYVSLYPNVDWLGVKPPTSRLIELYRETFPGPAEPHLGQAGSENKYEYGKMKALEDRARLARAEDHPFWLARVVGKGKRGRTFERRTWAGPDDERRFSAERGAGHPSGMFDVAWRAIKELGDEHGQEAVEQPGGTLLLWRSDYVAPQKWAEPRLGTPANYAWRFVKPAHAPSYAGLIDSPRLRRSTMFPLEAPKPADLVALSEYRPRTSSGGWRQTLRNAGPDEPRRGLERLAIAGDRYALEELRREAREDGSLAAAERFLGVLERAGLAARLTPWGTEQPAWETDDRAAHVTRYLLDHEGRRIVAGPEPLAEPIHDIEQLKRAAYAMSIIHGPVRPFYVDGFDGAFFRHGATVLTNEEGLPFAARAVEQWNEHGGSTHRARAVFARDDADPLRVRLVRLHHADVRGTEHEGFELRIPDPDDEEHVNLNAGNYQRLLERARELVERTDPERGRPRRARRNAGPDERRRALRRRADGGDRGALGELLEDLQPDAEAGDESARTEYRAVLARLAQPSRADIKDVVEFVRGLGTWMSFDVLGHADLEMSTRRHGNVGDEEPDALDLGEARRVKRAISEKFPSLNVRIETVDEWVHLSVKSGHKLYGSKELADALVRAMDVEPRHVTRVGGTWESAEMRFASGSLLRLFSPGHGSTDEPLSMQVFKPGPGGEPREPGATWVVGNISRLPAVLRAAGFLTGRRNPGEDEGLRELERRACAGDRGALDELLALSDDPLGAWERVASARLRSVFDPSSPSAAEASFHAIASELGFESEVPDLVGIQPISQAGDFAKGGSQATLERAKRVLGATRGHVLVLHLAGQRGGRQTELYRPIKSSGRIPWLVRWLVRRPRAKAERMARFVMAESAGEAEDAVCRWHPEDHAELQLEFLEVRPAMPGEEDPYWVAGTGGPRPVPPPG